MDQGAIQSAMGRVQNRRAAIVQIEAAIATLTTAGASEYELKELLTVKKQAQKRWADELSVFLDLGGQISYKLPPAL